MTHFFCSESVRQRSECGTAPSVFDRPHTLVYCGVGIPMVVTNNRRPMITHTMTHGCSPALLLSSIAATAGPSAAAVTAVVAGGVAAPTTSIDNGASHVIVHPIVLLSVLDHHTRRQEGGGRVIGTLLGKREGDRVRRNIYIL